MTDLLIIFLLTLVNGFFSISEIALVSVKKSRMELLLQKGSKRAEKVLSLTANPEKFLSSVQVGITLIGLITGAYGGATLGANFGIFVQTLGVPAGYAGAIAMITVFGGITYFSIVAGELVPKTVAINHAERVALFCAPVIHWFSIVVYPFVKLLSGSTNFIVKILGIKRKDGDLLSEEELRIMLKTAGKQGILEREEGAVHDNLFAFNDLKAKSLMTYYTDLEWINLEKTPAEIISDAKISTHSKLPVGAGSIDNIKGYITLSDFWKHAMEKEFSIYSILRQPLYLTENADTFDILSAFRKRKTHIGFVLDEYGSVRGVITLHDLMTALFGNLPDEDEKDEPQIIQRDEHTFLVDGSVTVFEFNQYFQHEFIEPSTHYTTVAGFLLCKLEGFPDEGEKITHHNMVFEVVDMDKVRIDKILLHIKGTSKN